MSDPQHHPPPSPAKSPAAKRTRQLDSPVAIMSSATANNTNDSNVDAPAEIPSSSTTDATTTTKTTAAATKISDSPPLLIKKLVPTAKPPTRGSAFAAGYDLYAAAPATIPSKGKGLVSTGLAIATPAGTYGRVAPRSGLASKNFIDTGAGVIDADYRGEVKVLLFNHAETDFEVKEGDRVAQLVLERIYTPEVQVVEELEESVRGAGGFGSTG